MIIVFSVLVPFLFHHRPLKSYTANAVCISQLFLLLLYLDDSVIDIERKLVTVGDHTYISEMAQEGHCTAGLPYDFQLSELKSPACREYLSVIPLIACTISTLVFFLQKETCQASMTV